MWKGPHERDGFGAPWAAVFYTGVVAPARPSLRTGWRHSRVWRREVSGACRGSEEPDGSRSGVVGAVPQGGMLHVGTGSRSEAGGAGGRQTGWCARAALLTSNSAKTLDAWLDAAIAECRASVPRRYGALPQPWIHRDIARSHVLRIGGRVTGILDFESADRNPRALDAVGRLLRMRPSDRGKGRGGSRPRASAKCGRQHPR